jgi:hypothetical protein
VSHRTTFKHKRARFRAAMTDWLASFEGSSVAHLQAEPKPSCTTAEIPEVPEPNVAEWMESQEFPTGAYLWSAHQERLAHLEKPQCIDASVNLPLPTERVTCRSSIAARINLKFGAPHASKRPACASIANSNAPQFSAA